MHLNVLHKNAEQLKWKFRLSGMLFIPHRGNVWEELVCH